MSNFNEYIEKLAEELYFEYGRSAEWKNYQGLPMPSWNFEENRPQLPDNIKKHWIAVAKHVWYKYNQN